MSVSCCFSFQFYIKPQQRRGVVQDDECCFSFQFYIKPQHPDGPERASCVVSHSNSTSNHNSYCSRLLKTWLFLIPILHQTTTPARVTPRLARLFLIPILHQTTTNLSRALACFGCFSFQFYIKPQQPARSQPARSRCFSFQFYIKPQRYRARGDGMRRCFSFQFYIKPQLFEYNVLSDLGCFSFQFYIKPQRRRIQGLSRRVVSHSNSTSNHNLAHGSNSYSARYTYDTDA